jgi:outer membrane protein OmpA-like peptidoglycan-associated protein
MPRLEPKRKKRKPERKRNSKQAQQQPAQARQQADQAEQQARQAAIKSQQEQQQLRASLLEQFNRILETRDTVRGLVVNMGDVLFTSGKFDLRPEARERLAKLSEIVIAHKGLNLAVEGHTDNVNTEGFNQKLSEERAGTVRAYLIAQGLDPNSITTAGYGMSQPVADNTTAAGRQKNRRVEIVISGEIIWCQDRHQAGRRSIRVRRADTVRVRREVEEDVTLDSANNIFHISSDCRDCMRATRRTKSKAECADKSLEAVHAVLRGETFFDAEPSSCMGLSE